mmetsp:Transcript_8509/g.12428  ORF Transcript_8509/g.12428 Transcript_8509/m.12428 type:complete len:83 (+) Transcript_8509:336-584(+)
MFPFSGAIWYPIKHDTSCPSFPSNLKKQPLPEFGMVEVCTDNHVIEVPPISKIKSIVKSLFCKMIFEETLLIVALYQKNFSD